MLPGPGFGPATVHVTIAGTTIKRHRSACGTMTRIRNGRVRVQGICHVSDSANESAKMKAVIFHNPMCGTSRKTLEILRKEGAEVWVREYLQAPPSRDELKRLYDRAGITPRDGLRAKEPLADELDLNRPDVTDHEVLDAMMQHPILINRPLVETPKGVRLCRPQDTVREIL